MNKHLKKYSNESIFRQRNTKINYINQLYLFLILTNMLFFKKGTAKYDLDYKLRNILIDYFKEVDTVPLITDVRITVEK